jgi:hypothetical protein
MTPRQRKAAVRVTIHLVLLLIAVGLLLATNWPYAWLILAFVIAYGVADAAVRLWGRNRRQRNIG